LYVFFHDGSVEIRVKAIATTACTASEGIGVRKCGCTVASQRGSRPSRAIAYGTRAAVNTIPLFEPSVAVMMATATSPAPAAPNDAICLPSGASDQRGARFATLPPGNTNPTTISTITSPILVRVSTFCVTAPSLTPSELSTVSPTIDATATALVPPSPSGKKKPT